MGWRRPEMRCMFATNCALRKSFLRRHFDRDGLLRVLADHRAANDAVGDVLGVDAADLVLPGFRRLRHPQVGFVAHEWSLKNGHVGSIQLLQQTLNRADEPAALPPGPSAWRCSSRSRAGPSRSHPRSRRLPRCGLRCGRPCGRLPVPRTWGRTCDQPS